MFMDLVDQIELKLSELEKLFREVDQELMREELPAEWSEEISEADEAAQNCCLEIGEASNFQEQWGVVYTMLRKIDKWDKDQDDAWAKEHPLNAGIATLLPDQAEVEYQMVVPKALLSLCLDLLKTAAKYTGFDDDYDLAVAQLRAHLKE